MLWAASIMAFMPEAQTLLIVVAGNDDKPANIAAWVAGACPKFADNTLPIYTSCMCSGFNPAFSIADFITMLPNVVAEIPAKLPPKLPIGVRVADTMTTSFINDVRIGEANLSFFMKV